MSKIITGWTTNIQCKNGMTGMVIHYVDDTMVSSDKDYGHITGSQFLDQKEFEDGTIVRNGSLTVGAPVRIFKENQGGLDKVTLIEVGDVKYDLFKNPIPAKDSKK